MYITRKYRIPYKDPWSASYIERLNDLRGGNIRIAYYYSTPDSATFRYRVYNMIQALKHTNQGISASCFFEKELERLLDIIDMIDILVICRVQYCERIDQLITIARNRGKTVIYDIDDMVFDIKYVPLILNTIDAELKLPGIWNYRFGEVARYGATLSLCDKIITTNTYLAERLREFSHKEVSIIPNFLNEEQLAISGNIYEDKKSGNFIRKDPVYIGYFSGSNTHNKDFRIVSDSLIHILEKYDNVKLLIMGHLQLDKRFRKIKDKIIRLPYKDFINLQYYISQVEINLIPLQENIYNNCKSELKYFEAGIVGTVSIASPTYVYSESIRDGVNGFISNSYEWGDKLEYLLGNDKTIVEVAENAHMDSARKYSWNNMLGIIENTFLN